MIPEADARYDLMNRSTDQLIQPISTSSDLSDPSWETPLKPSLIHNHSERPSYHQA